MRRSRLASTRSPPGAATQVDIQLYPAASVTTDANGVVTFADTNSDNIADWGSPVGAITVVNGAGASGTRANNVVPVNGAVTFTIDDSAVAGAVIPVVYADANASNSLNLVVPTVANALPKQPSEAFGIGGMTTWTPVQAASAAFVVADGDVKSVDKTGNSFVADPSTVAGTDTFTYFYDSNDTFQSSGVPVTMASFEAALSTGDGMATPSVYTRDPAASSVFNLRDVAPTKPATITFSAITTTTTTVNWTAPSTGAPDTYNVYRTATAPVDVTDVTEYTKVGSVAGDAAALKFVNTGLSANTTYYYAVTAVQDAEESQPAHDSQATDAVSTAAAYSTAAAFVDNSTGGNLFVNAGDIARVQFSGVVTVDPAASITVIDNDGTTATIACGTTAICTTTGTTSTLLTLTFNIAPTPTALGSDGALGSVKVEVTGATGISNAYGDWNLPRSGQNAAGFNRVIGGTNANMPAAFGTGDVTADDSLNNVVIVASSSPATGDTVNVYNANGVLLGTGTYNNGTGLTITGMTTAAGEIVYVTYVSAASGYESITLAETVVA